VNTGDPVQDSIVFATAKQAWAAEHPGFFQPTTPPSTDE
jgi:hypothetical protein